MKNRGQTSACQDNPASLALVLLLLCFAMAVTWPNYSRRRPDYSSNPCRHKNSAIWLFLSGVAPPNQTKERSVHELFAGAFQNKSSMWIVLVFLRKNTRIYKKGRNSWTFRFGPFFGLVCWGDSWFWGRSGFPVFSSPFLSCNYICFWNSPCSLHRECPNISEDVIWL